MPVIFKNVKRMKIFSTNNNIKHILMLSISSSGQCIPANFVCDNQNDCTGGEDELGCIDYFSQQEQR